MKYPKYIKCVDNGLETYAKIVSVNRDNAYNLNIWIISNSNYKTGHGIARWPNRRLEEISEEEYLLAEILDS